MSNRLTPELPELLGGAGILEQHMVDLERVHFANAEAVYCIRDVREQLGELRLVVRGHRLACLLALGVPRHDSRLVNSPARDRWRRPVPDAGSLARRRRSADRG